MMGVLDVGVVVGCGSLAPPFPSPSPPAPLPLLLGVLGERGVCSWGMTVLVGVWEVWEGVVVFVWGVCLFAKGADLPLPSQPFPGPFTNGVYGIPYCTWFMNDRYIDLKGIGKHFSV